MLSPLASTCVSTRLPLTKVPLRLPRSRRITSGPSVLSLAWKRLTRGEASTTWLRSARPMVMPGSDTGTWLVRPVGVIRISIAIRERS